VIVGGGELIDSIRHMDAVHQADPVEVHWMCVELLDVTAKFLSHRLGWPLIASEEEFQKAFSSGLQADVADQPQVVAVSSFYRPDTHAMFPEVPLDWRTTTDTIAAIGAKMIHADELVLLKSCQVDFSAGLQQLATSGIVDEALPGLNVGSVKIRTECLPGA
jgi:aspartokinase-like uncharacterized kinase